ncbi:Glycerol-3-phosphate O-acyltransferase 2 [Vanrija pseudolonga]|uniref:Glycerol-3-phosphate O-acyltransferase 2 n=1 Tax=Vanrija pseudolonga TaxID=143232 RepID=A0AAF0YAA9_9TREE|nr:Glycerol-3-phosphate O-acyltransferase 2 [Vanrija pseudolonga]
MTFGFSHKPLVQLAGSAITSFYRKIEVYGAENVPDEGPIIFACTHTNMAIDPAILSNTIPHKHRLHYWVKDSLFKNPAMKAMLTNAGNIPVDRKTKNNQLLFRGTFEALAQDECIGVFPEGTSHTEPHLIPLKDGTSWTALEYLVYLNGSPETGGPHKGKPAIIVPVGIAYCDKTKYRSRLAVTYGPALSMDAYREEFLSTQEGASKSAVKRLTADTALELHKMTVNAPDWDTAFAAQMARQLLWKYEDDLALADYVDVAQTLVDLFSTKDNDRIDRLKGLLVTYRDLLFSSRLSNYDLTDLPLPKSLDPSRPTPLPGRLRTLAILIKDTIVCLFQFPLFIAPFIFNLPIYAIGIWGASLAEDEIESQAQNKIFLGLFLSFLTFPIAFFIFFYLFWSVPFGFVFAAGSVWLLSRYHAALIDSNYNALKKLIAAWRVLVGVWLGPGVEMSLNKFVDSAASFAPNPPAVAGLPPGTPKEKYTKPQHLPSRVLVRHVLRTRVQAARELSDVLLELEDQDARLKAKYWLAERYGGEVTNIDHTDNVPEYERHWPQRVRGAREVIAFLRGRGARFASAGREEHWAAASSGDEGDGKNGKTE